MWVSHNCLGIFSLSSNATVCGSQSKQSRGNVICSAGQIAMPDHSCGLMLLTTFFTQKKDWQRQKKAKPDFGKVRKLYRSALRLGLNVTVLYDDLPEELMGKYRCSNFAFHQVNLSEFDKRYGVNDVRYFLFDRLVTERHSWRFVFVVDAFDVIIGMNPCKHLLQNSLSQKEPTLYVGAELESLQGHPWMKARFEQMGGKYKKWFKSFGDRNLKILNCGITGGDRQAVLRFFRHMKDIISDPLLHVRESNAKAAAEHRKGQDIHVNMPALNYLAYNGLLGKIVSNEPVHSKYKNNQGNRTDVWFIHK